MGFRRKKEDTIIEHHWKQFVSTHAALFLEIGLPQWISNDHEYWQDVIHYGYPEQYQGGTPVAVTMFNANQVEPSELTKFVQLLERHFEAGFAYCEPAFLKWRDRQAYDRIVAQFAPD